MWLNIMLEHAMFPCWLVGIGETTGSQGGLARFIHKG